MTPDRSTRRLIAFSATGVCLVVSLAFGAVAIVPAVQLSRGAVYDRQEKLTVAGIGGVCSLLGLVGFIQFARIATGRKKIVWSWGDHVPTTVDGKTDVERK